MGGSAWEHKMVMYTLKCYKFIKKSKINILKHIMAFPLPYWEYRDKLLTFYVSKCGLKKKHGEQQPHGSTYEIEFKCFWTPLKIQTEKYFINIRDFIKTHRIESFLFSALTYAV